MLLFKKGKIQNDGNFIKWASIFEKQIYSHRKGSTSEKIPKC